MARIIYIFRIEVIGCPDPEIPHGAVLKRAGDLATVSCHGKSTAWHLTCNGVSWSGKTESCVNPPSRHGQSFDTIARHRLIIKKTDF